jgi:hypothetical protein
MLIAHHTLFLPRPLLAWIILASKGRPGAVVSSIAAADTTLGKARCGCVCGLLRIHEYRCITGDLLLASKGIKIVPALSAVGREHQSQNPTRTPLSLFTHSILAAPTTFAAFTPHHPHAVLPRWHFSCWMQKRALKRYWSRPFRMSRSTALEARNGCQDQDHVSNAPTQERKPLFHSKACKVRAISRLAEHCIKEQTGAKPPNERPELRAGPDPAAVHSLSALEPSSATETSDSITTLVSSAPATVQEVLAGSRLAATVNRHEESPSAERSVGRPRHNAV